MNAVDSSSWLEYFGKGPRGERYVPILRASHSLVVPVICISEVFKRFCNSAARKKPLKQWR